MKKKGSPAIYNSDGTIKTGMISGWHDLSRSDKNIVISERKRLGIRPGIGKNKTWSRTDGEHTKANNANRMKQLEEQNKKYKRTIKAMKRKGDDEQAENDSNGITDAGDTFGGKVTKKKKGDEGEK